MKNPLVSVLTPVYNGENYLSQCVESVLSQTYPHWEYIISNNRSNDRTLEIAERYASKDCRIRVYTNPDFVPVAENHNRALQYLSPESVYCKFIHADDWMFPECLERMVELAETHPTVGLVGAYRLDNTRVNLDGLPYPSTVVGGKEISRLSLLGKIRVLGSPSSSLFRSKFARCGRPIYDGLRFPRHSDKAFCFEILKQSDFGFVHQVLTYTRRPPEAGSSFSLQMQSYLSEDLLMLKEYGPWCLGQEEYRYRFDTVMSYYRRFLGKSVFKKRGKDFWHYQRKALQNLGLTLSTGQLLSCAILPVKEVFFAPYKALRRTLLNL